MRKRVNMVDPQDPSLSICRQVNLLGVSRSTYYYEPVPETEYNLQLMRLIDQQYVKTPYYGRRRMTEHLNRLSHDVNDKRVSRLMKNMGIEAMYPKPKKGLWDANRRKFPYLLKNVEISSKNHVWGTDITYIPMENGYLYLVAVLDLYSRLVLSWELSNNLESDFCIRALEKALLLMVNLYGFWALRREVEIRMGGS